MNLFKKWWFWAAIAIVLYLLLVTGVIGKTS